MGLLGGSCRTLQRNSGYVDRGHSPAPVRQPDGVGSLAASHVECGTRFEVAHFGDEGSVGFTAPYLFGIRVPPVPFGVISVDSHEVCVVGTSMVVTVRFRLIGRVGHGPSGLPRQSLIDGPGEPGQWG